MDASEYVSKRANLSMFEALGGPNPPIVISDDGDGPYVSKWEVAGEKPTPEEIADAISAQPR